MKTKIFAAIIFAASISACTSTPQLTLAEKAQACAAEGGEYRQEGRFNVCAYQPRVAVSFPAKGYDTNKVAHDGKWVKQ